jgi:SAM-dependent methyltransferase
VQRWAVVEPVVDRIAPGRVLEIGCGRGGFGGRLARRSDYVGVEQDAVSAATARAWVEPVGGRIVHGRLDDVEGDRFDLVCAFEVLEHIEDDRRAVDEWANRLRPGGWMLLSVPADPERYGPFDVEVGHYRRYDPDDIEKLMADGGFVDVEVTRYGWPLGYLTEWLRNFYGRRTGRRAAASMDTRTAASGRRFQPGPRVWPLIRVAAGPFARIQRLRPDLGVGLIVLARKDEV